MTMLHDQLKLCLHPPSLQHYGDTESWSTVNTAISPTLIGSCARLITYGIKISRLRAAVTATPGQGLKRLVSK
jgi:hypothetical protein